MTGVGVWRGRRDPGACAPGLPTPKPAASPDMAPTDQPVLQIVGILGTAGEDYKIPGLDRPHHLSQ